MTLVVGQQEGHLACEKTEWWDAGMVMCYTYTQTSQGADLHMVQLMPLSLAPVNPDWFYLPGFTFLVPAHPFSPGQNPEGSKMVVCACVCVCVFVLVNRNITYLC